MCGIVATFNGDLFEPLKQLQNRGYDSAGVSFVLDNTIECIKYASTQSRSAIEMLNIPDVECGIGHTRWATHGAKTDTNAHPHISNDGKFHLVHNGIIENYLELKMFLMNHGYTFKSDTDSEVIVNLIQHLYTGSIMDTINMINTMLTGSWAICVLLIENNEPVICGTRCGSPLLVGKKGMIVSEMSGFCDRENEYLILDELDVVLCKANGPQLQRDYEFIQLDRSQCITLSPSFNHWTIQEIYEQAESSIKSVIIDGRIDKNTGMVKLEGLDMNESVLRNIDNLILVGCGTSLNVALFAKRYFTTFNTVQVINASEFDVVDVPKIGKTAMILISQSGETRDTYNCLTLAKSMGVFTMGVINVRNSLIAREVDCGCYTNVGKENGVASTKSFTGQAIVLYLMAMWLSRTILTQINFYNDIRATLQHHDYIKSYITPMLDNCNSCFILGKGQNYALAREGALKIKEISYIHAEAYELSELKHGPLALLTNDTVVIIIGDDEIDNCYHEVISRGSSVIVVTNSYKCDNRIHVPSSNKLLYVIPLQLLAYECSLRRGLNPDMPRNLAKVVTVA